MEDTRWNFFSNQTHNRLAIAPVKQKSEFSALSGVSSRRWLGWQPAPWHLGDAVLCSDRSFEILGFEYSDVRVFTQQNPHAAMGLLLWHLRGWIRGCSLLSGENNWRDHEGTSSHIKSRVAPVKFLFWIELCTAALGFQNFSSLARGGRLFWFNFYWQFTFLVCGRYWLNKLKSQSCLAGPREQSRAWIRWQGLSE